MSSTSWMIWTFSLIVHAGIALCAGWFFAVSKDARRENKVLRERLDERNSEICRLRLDIRNAHELARGVRSPFPAPANPKNSARIPAVPSGFGCNEPDGNLRQ